MSIKYKAYSVRSQGSTHRSSFGGSADVSGTKFIMPLNYGGLGSRFFDQLSTESDKILQVDTINNITETRGSVKARATRLAIEMQSKGVGKKDIILISSMTHAHQTIVVVATLFLGAIVCPVCAEAPFKECLELVRKLKPKMCFCDSRTVSQIDRILLTLNMTSEIVSFGTEVSGTTQFCKLFPFREDNSFRPYFIDSPHKEVAFIIPTQGTCSDPKLVCLSHHNMYLQCLNFMELFENPCKVISFFPLSWITQTISTCASLEFGVTRIMAPSFSERTACKMIHDFVIDVAVLGTELALRLTGNVAVKDYNLNCLKFVLVGVVNTTRRDLHQMRRALPNVKFLQVYCLTETGFIAAVPSSNYGDTQIVNKDLFNFSAALEKPYSVGQLMKNCKVKIIDTETKHPIGPNAIGELYFRGDGLMLGYNIIRYFKNNSATMAAMEKGYFRTGDLAKYDEEGWIYLAGRIDDMVVYDDIAFIPKDAEDVIETHPYVHDVVMIGNNSEIVVCIEKKPDTKLTADEILKFFKDRMPHFDKPISSIVFLEHFPRTKAGNIKKRILRDQYLKVKIEYTRSLASISPSTLDET